MAFSFRSAQVSRADDAAQRGEYTVSEQHHEVEEKRHMRIHIDQKHYESPSPTTGEALYMLGNVAAGMELYREVSGDREDAPIEKGSETVHLKEDEHFHSGPPKTYRVYINGQEKLVATGTMTFEEIVALAFPNPPTGQNILFTVGYEDGPHVNPMGSLMPGGKIKIKDGMIFNVTPTDKS